MKPQTNHKKRKKHKKGWAELQKANETHGKRLMGSAKRGIQANGMTSSKRVKIYLQKKSARQMPKSNIQTSVCDSQNPSTKTFTEAQAKAAVPGAAL